MIKSPAQWAQTFEKLSKSDDFIVSVDMQLDQLNELKVMFQTLAKLVSVDDIKTILDTDESF